MRFFVVFSKSWEVRRRLAPRAIGQWIVPEMEMADELFGDRAALQRRQSLAMSWSSPVVPLAAGAKRRLEGLPRGSMQPSHAVINQACCGCMRCIGLRPNTPHEIWTVRGVWGPRLPPCSADRV